MRFEDENRYDTSSKEYLEKYKEEKKILDAYNENSYSFSNSVIKWTYNTVIEDFFKKIETDKTNTDVIFWDDIYSHERQLAMLFSLNLSCKEDKEQYLKYLERIIDLIIKKEDSANVLCYEILPTIFNNITFSEKDLPFIISLIQKFAYSDELKPFLIDDIWNVDNRNQQIIDTFLPLILSQDIRWNNKELYALLVDDVYRNIGKGWAKHRSNYYEKLLDSPYISQEKKDQYNQLLESKLENHENNQTHEREDLITYKKWKYEYIIDASNWLEIKNDKDRKFYRGILNKKLADKIPNYREIKMLLELDGIFNIWESKAIESIFDKYEEIYHYYGSSVVTDVLAPLLNNPARDISKRIEKYVELVEKLFKNKLERYDKVEKEFPVLFRLDLFKFVSDDVIDEWWRNFYEEWKNDPHVWMYVMPFFRERFNPCIDAYTYEYLDWLSNTFNWIKECNPSQVFELDFLLDKWDFKREDIRNSKPVDSIDISELVGIDTYWWQLSLEEISFIHNDIDNIFTPVEKDWLYLDLWHDGFREIIEAYKNNDLFPIWCVKQKYYNQEEKEKVNKLRHYFWADIYQYFLKKVNPSQSLKERFRNPHDAVRYANYLIELCDDIISRTLWKTPNINIAGFEEFNKYRENAEEIKSRFLKNFLAQAGDRENGYQQINNFFDKIDWDRDVKIEKELADNENWLKTEEFIKLATQLLKDSDSLKLYENMDQLERILPILSMIQRKGSLQRLENLSTSEDEKDKARYEYFKRAIFHPRTNNLIINLYDKPYEILSMNDETLWNWNHILHDIKKPIKLVENFPNLDFKDKDLVDCLPLGVLDKLTYFKPYKKSYLISQEECYDFEKVEGELIQFLQELDPKNISKIITYLNKNWKSLSFKKWKNNPEEFSKELFEDLWYQELIDTLVALWYSDFSKYKNLKYMTAHITEKSDPNNWFNGFNCDSFAQNHWKKVVAMFNPFCSDFCIYDWERCDSQDNLKVTSWVTLNRKISQNFGELLDKLRSSTKYNISEVFWESFRKEKDAEEYIITMDNIEADPNFWKNYTYAIAKLYKNFFSEYIEKYPVSPNNIPINPKKFNAWMNYNKLHILKKIVDNDTVPIIMNSYTDNSGKKTYEWELSANVDIKREDKNWIYPLTLEDILPLSYLESEKNRDYSHETKTLEQEVVAMTLNNTLKWRRNIAITWYEKWKLLAYILAYEWKLHDESTIILSSFVKDDWVDEKIAEKLLRAWINKIKETYPNYTILIKNKNNIERDKIKKLADVCWYNLKKGFDEFVLVKEN